MIEKYMKQTDQLNVTSEKLLSSTEYRLHKKKCGIY